MKSFFANLALASAQYQTWPEEDIRESFGSLKNFDKEEIIASEHKGLYKKG